MDPTAKQQVVERVKAANNVLVTVSTNPSVDQLASAIGLTLMINTMGKHATAVFSGKIPDTMQFLNPAKTLENTVDSLRDFIIALDKNKADKLRYKVEDDVVKIFITPYRTRISEADLQFSQGDYNVDVVLALGVHDKNDLDKVIVEHGRILHDAAVISVNSGVNAGNLGSINWIDNAASSLSEMLMSISEALQPGLVDEQVATALLTGIVSETERFSNEKTTPKVMTMAAQLMAAGANQQLIASHLHPTITGASVVTPEEAPKKSKDPSEMDINHDSSEPGDGVAKPPANSEPPADISSTPPSEPAAKDEPTPLEISDTAPLDDRPLPEPVDAAPLDPVPAPASGLPNSLPPGPIADMIHDTKSFSVNPADAVKKPAMGGTFSATATEAHDAAIKSRETEINNTILSHDIGTEEPDTAPTVKAAPLAPPSEKLPTKPTVEPPVEIEPPQPFGPAPAMAMPPVPSSPPTSAPSMPPGLPAQVGEINPAAAAQQFDSETLDSIDASARNGEAPEAEGESLGSLDLESARKAVEAAMGGITDQPETVTQIEPIQAIGINGRLDVHPENLAPPMPEPAPTPAGPTAGAFGSEPLPVAQNPDVSFTPPPVFGDTDANMAPPPAVPPPFGGPNLPAIGDLSSPPPLSNEPPMPSTPPTIGQHDAGYMSTAPASAPAGPPTGPPASPGAAQPAPDDFQLPSIT